MLSLTLSSKSFQFLPPGRSQSHSTFLSFVMTALQTQIPKYVIVIYCYIKNYSKTQQFKITTNNYFFSYFIYLFIYFVFVYKNMFQTHSVLLLPQIFLEEQIFRNTRYTYCCQDVIASRPPQLINLMQVNSCLPKFPHSSFANSMFFFNRDYRNSQDIVIFTCLFNMIIYVKSLIISKLLYLNYYNI